MKFLLIVLAIHTVVEMAVRKNKKAKNITNGTAGLVRHPAEYELR